MTSADKLEVEVTCELDGPASDAQRLCAAVRRALSESSITAGRVDIAVIDDKTMQEMNCRYLGHDYPTDALSFLLSQSPGSVEGQIAVSIDTARREAARLGWAAEDELLLYVVHGALHLAGYDDTTPDAADEMRLRERDVLATFGLSVPWDDEQSTAADEKKPSKESCTR